MLEGSVVRVRVHSNGFYKIELETTLPGKHCMHYWPDVPPLTSDIHSHRWMFESQVVFGALTETRYQVVAPGFGQKLIRHSYSSPGDGASFGLRPSGAVWIDKSSCMTRTPAEPYSVSADLFHQVVPKVAPVLTFVRQGLPTATAYVLRPLPAEERQASQLLDSSATAALCDQLRGLLSGPTGGST
jgi:hypothetical protein